MKQTPKSCNCPQCKAGKSTKGGQYMMARMQRALRTAWRAQRLQVDPVVSPSPIGNRFD